MVCVLNHSYSAFAQVNNIRNRSSDNQSDRNINRNFVPPANPNSGNNSSTLPPPSIRKVQPSNPNNNSQSTTNNGNTQNATEVDLSNLANDTESCCSSILSGCSIVNSMIKSFLAHQRFLTQSKVVNSKIVSFELFALGSFPFLYSNDSIGNQFYPKSVFASPKIRANWGLTSTEFRYTNLHQFNTGSYETIDWQVLILNLFSRKEFYLRIGTGFMYEKFSGLYFNEHTLSTDILLSRRLSGTFDFRIAQDTETQIIPRLESGTRINYRLLETKHVDFNFTLGFLYQNYYQTDKLYFIQTGLGLILH